MFYLLQQLIRNQMALGLTYLEEGDITIKLKTFNPKNTLMTMIFKTAETEMASWAPTESQNRLWIKDENLFQKVRHTVRYEQKCID